MNSLILLLGCAVVFFVGMYLGYLVTKIADSEKIDDLEIERKTLFDTTIAQSASIKNLQEEIARTRDELLAGKKKWQYFENRFVECNTCNPEKKEKCLMFSEMLCEGERCTEMVDIVSLMDSACEKELKID